MLKVTVDLRAVEGAADVLGYALALQAKPSDWRASEYAMTKAAASRLVYALRGAGLGPVELDYFGVSCLVGEVARLYLGAERQAEEEDAARGALGCGGTDTAEAALRVFAALQSQCLANPEVAAAEADARAYEKEERTLAVIKERLEAAALRLKERERAHAAGRK